MYSLNGIGTTLYGKREVNIIDGSYIATKWFIIFFLPIIPLGTYRVWEINATPPKFYREGNTKYKMEGVELNWKQIVNTYLSIWGSLALLGILGWFSIH